MKTFSKWIFNSFLALVVGILIGSLFCGGPVALAKLTIDAVEIVNANRYNGNAIIAVPDGGSGAGTFTDHGVLVGAGTSAFTALIVGTTGQTLIGATGADPVMTTIKGVASKLICEAINGTTAPDAAEILTDTKSIEVRQFSGVANQDVRYVWKAPFDLTSATISVAVTGIVSHATAPATGEVIAYSISAASRGNSDPLSTATSGTQTSSLTADATYVQYDFLQTAFSTAMTVTDLAAGESINIDVTRLATTTDTYAQKIGQEGILIKYSLALSGT